MAILGSLIVELKASTASFIEGMGGAAKTARAVGREIESSFSELGSFAGKALAPFGVMGSVIAQTFAQVGEQAGGAITSFGKMGGSMGLVAAGGAGVVAAVGAAGIASLGLAAHMAESAAKSYELSQATGVSIETLTGFAYVAKQSGVDSDVMTKGLERLSKAIFTAATAAPGTVNAFTRLGISVRDSQGNIKDAGTVMTELAGKFSGMQDGTAKTALAMQLFGRGGAALVPLLNQGKEGIAGWMSEAQALGIVLDEQTGEAAHRFEQSLNTMQAAGQGMAMQLMKELLPALQTVSTALVEGLKDKDSGLRTMIDGFAFLAKVVLGTGETIWAVLKQVGIAVGDLLGLLFEGAKSAFSAFWKASTGDLGGAISTAEEGYGRIKAIGKSFFDDSKKDWQDYSKFTAGLVAPLPKAAERKAAATAIDTSAAAAKPDLRLASINKTIEGLKAQTAAELALAGATDQSVAAQNIQKAAGEADQIITRLMAEADRTTGAERTKLIGVIKEETGAIRALTAEKQVAKDAVAIDAELNKETLAYDRQIASLRAMAVAYTAGGSAIGSALIEQRLEADRQKVAQLEEEYMRLEGIQGVSSDALAKIKGALDQANAALNDHREQLEAIRALNYDVEINKQGDAMRGVGPYLDNLNAAYLENSEAVRQAEVAIQTYNWQLAHPGATPEQVAAINKQFDQQSLDAERSRRAQEAGQFSLSMLYDRQVGELEHLREVMQQNHKSTLLIDASILDANNRFIQQWDEAALKVGNFGTKFRGVLNELVVQGREAGAQMMQAIMGAIDGAETELAKLLTGQKTNFKQVFQGLAEQLTKGMIQQSIGGLFGKLGFGGKADGSQASPFYVIPMGGPGGLLGAAAGAASAAGGGGGGIGGLFSSVFSLFGGGKAGGGDLTPGHWYVAGERGPEIIAPKSPGMAIPMGKGSQTQIVNNFNGVRDVDMFRRSENQIMSQFHRQSAIAYGRS